MLELRDAPKELKLGLKEDDGEVTFTIRRDRHGVWVHEAGTKYECRLTRNNGAEIVISFYNVDGTRQKKK